jgi:hypothetical protein
MRLLHTGTLLFEEFPRNSPLYAILSHTWAKEEVLYQDILSGTASFKPAWNKITKCWFGLCVDRHLLHLGMSLLLTMPCERVVHLPPKTTGSGGHPFWSL